MRKAVYPTRIERQNVSLAASGFDSKHVAAVDIAKNQGTEVTDGTIPFSQLIIKWWSMSNVQHPMEGKYTSDDSGS